MMEFGHPRLVLRTNPTMARRGRASPRRGAARARASGRRVRRGPTTWFRHSLRTHRRGTDGTLYAVTVRRPPAPGNRGAKQTPLSSPGCCRVMCGRVRQLSLESDDIVVSRTFLKLILDSIDRAEAAAAHAVQISSSARAAFEDLPCTVRIARVFVRQRFTAVGFWLAQAMQTRGH